MSESGWKNVALRDIATDIKDGTHGTHPRVESGVPFLSAKNIAASGKVVWTEEDDAISEAEYQLITSSFTPKAGDLLVTIVGSLGRTAIFGGEKVAFQRSVAFVRPNKEVLPEFLFQASAATDFARQLEQRSNATAQAGLYLGELAKVRIPLPAMDQQRRIAEILSTLDEAIEQTEALIAKMQQVKAGLMHDLFTRGVTPDGRLRPTRAQAPELYKKSPLGWIPKEWEVCSWGQLTASWAMGPRFSAEEYSNNGNVATMRTTDMNDDGVVTYSTMPRAKLDLTGLAQHLLQPNDFVISRSGTCGIGAVFEGFEIPVLPGAFLIRFRFLPKISPFFMRYYVNSRVGSPAVARIAEGGVQKNIRGTGLCRLLLPVPSKDEQATMIERLSTIDRLADHEAAKLAKLYQQKLGLMHDLLTGRVRTTERVASA